jgi:hypothetical protein
MAFEPYGDSPNQIRFEGQEIQLKLERTSPTTARISWNIPAPAAGCSADKQAYDGIVITLDTSRTRPSKNPTDGVKYESDPTASETLFAGDKLDTSHVVGAFYNDKTTVYVDVSDLSPDESYYASGFAVDQVLQYHTQGVHSYSLPVESVGNVVDATHGSQTIGLGNTYSGTDPINLPAGPFSFEILIDDPDKNGNAGYSPKDQPGYKTIQISGTGLSTWGDLVNEIEKQLALSTGATNSPVAPQTGQLYWDGQKHELFIWNGSGYDPLAVIYEPIDPAILNVGSIWYNGQLLQEWNGSAWTNLPYIDFNKEPNNPNCDYWCDGSKVYKIENGVWCEQVSYYQATDPSLANQIQCGTIWYDSINGFLFKWDDSSKSWTSTDAIYFGSNPNNVSTGDLWFNDSTNILFEWDGTAWQEKEKNIKVCKKAPSNPITNQYFYNSKTQTLKQYDGTAWQVVNAFIYTSAPNDRDSCDLWWNSVSDVLNIWDTINNQWVVVSNFIQSEVDPSLPPKLPLGSVWVDGSGKEYVWDSTKWDEIECISWPTDPLTISAGTVWKNGDVWKKWDGTTWNAIDPINSVVDPSTLPLNTYWYDSTNNTLQSWNGTGWIPLAFGTTKIIPNKGDLWFDSSTNTLKEWTGNKWEEKSPPAKVELVDGGIKFESSSLGHDSNIFIKGDTDTLFPSAISPEKPTYLNPTDGIDSASKAPLYATLGVGTDGSPDERRELIDSIRSQLGYPQVEVELTKQQFDYCIDAGIEEIRKRSGAAYKRGWVFLQTEAGQQEYKLTNTGTGFNKIVDILDVIRSTGRLGGSGHNSVFEAANTNFQYSGLGNYDLLTHHLGATFAEELGFLSASKIMYHWNEQTRTLMLMQRIHHSERLMLEVTVERTEQDLIQDRYLKSWIEGWAQAQAMILLYQIRGKYASLPGAGGGITLNAMDMYSTAMDMMAKLDSEVENFVVEFPEEYGMGSTFILG